MIQEETQLAVHDNSGVKRVKCIRVKGGSKRRYAGVGDTIVCSVRQVDPKSSYKKRTVVLAIVVQTKSQVRRVDGSFYRYMTNACVLIDEKGQLIGTRIMGSVPNEVRVSKAGARICSLAQEVI